MPQLAPKVIKARAQRLRAAAARRKTAWLDGLIGSRQRVLVERNGRGHAENFAEVEIDRPVETMVGRTIDVLVTGRRDERLVAAAS
jgi:threonylcarbamoyladenosine tRNA methylthiotransferase MtaB